MSAWTLDIQDMSWVEHTGKEVDFVVESLGLHGGERILDLKQRGLTMMAAYGTYSTSVPASDDPLMLVVCSHRER